MRYIFSAIIILSLLVINLAVSIAEAARIKDLATFGGVRNNQLIGYGLVVGLSGTGDKRDSAFTVGTMVNMLEKMGIGVDTRQIRPKNVAAVMVTAQMPVSSKPGTTLDITVSSMGDCTSLLGGILLQTPLKGVDGKIYALAQGALLIGGFTVDGAVATASKNVSTVGQIPNGANVERGVPFDFNDQDKLTLNMKNKDFSTTMQVAERLNEAMGGQYAKAIDITTIDIDIPAEYKGNLVPLMASVENIEINPQQRAKIVINERTGTVVLGNDVTISQVAVAHGNLQVVVQNGADVSQPPPLSGGQTVVTPTTNINVNEEKRRLVLVEGVTLKELVDGLNAIGASPRDLMSILYSMQTSGALNADLEVI